MSTGSNDSPRAAEPASAGAPLLLQQAIGRIDAAGKLAIVCIVFGWFFMSTIVVSLGSLQHGVRFYDLGAVIADPMRLFFGIDSPFKRVSFGLICAACVAAPLWPHLVQRRVAWLAYLAPLALMLACGLLLYLKTSGDTFVTPGRVDTVAHSVLRFANDMARHGGDLVAKHIAIGPGAYLALIGCLVLTAQGLRRYAEHR